MQKLSFLTICKSSISEFKSSPMRTNCSLNWCIFGIYEPLDRHISPNLVLNFFKPSKQCFNDFTFSKDGLSYKL